MKFSYSLVAAGLALTGLLSACGGGGGGTAAAPVPPPVALTTSNMNAAAQDTTATAFMPIQSSQVLTGAQVTDESLLFNIAREQLDKLPIYMANAAANSSLAGVISTPVLVNCGISGNLSVTVNDADNNGMPSAGDIVTITANSCVESSGTLSGSLSFRFNTLSGTFGTAPYSAGFTLTFGNFTVTGPQFSASANGSLTLALTVTGVNAFTSSVSTPSLSVSGTYGAVTRTRSLLNYSATATRTVVGMSYQTSHTINGTVTSTALNSLSLTFATTTPFVVQGLDDYPSTGQMVITGASGSKLRITAVTNATATEELDANGDGIYEVAPVTVNWNTLY